MAHRSRSGRERALAVMCLALSMVVPLDTTGAANVVDDACGRSRCGVSEWRAR